MELTRHKLDPYPNPKDKLPLFVNEPMIADRTLMDYYHDCDFKLQSDNIRIYVPIDLNREFILRRLDEIIYRYGEANEKNESDFRLEVNNLFFQVEIYDQIWYVRHMPENGDHSEEAKQLVREFIQRLEDIPDGCAECFPFEMIDDLREEFMED